MNPRKFIPVIAVIALAGCSSGDPGPITPEQAARADYARIAAAADTVMFGDVLGYLPGAADPERVGAACAAGYCSIGFGRAFGSDGFSVDEVELEILPDRNGVRKVVERGSTERSDVTVFGGWMKHSFFGSQANLVTDEKSPNAGATVVYSFAIGSGTGTNPDVLEGGATWRGFVAARDASVAGDLDSVVSGDASVSVRPGQAALRADVAFTGLANARTRTSYDDMTWKDLAVSGGAFGRQAGAGDTLQGHFFGPDQEEVGGVFERDGLAGAFGATRE